MRRCAVATATAPTPAAPIRHGPPTTTVTEYDHHNPEAGGHTSYENLNTKCRYGHITKTFGDWVDDQYRDPATGRLVTEYITPEGFVIPGDDEWPAGLDDLEHRPSAHGGVPLGLWVRGGRDLAEAVERSVALVGSRASTASGRAAEESVTIAVRSRRGGRSP